MDKIKFFDLYTALQSVYVKLKMYLPALVASVIIERLRTCSGIFYSLYNYLVKRATYNIPIFTAITFLG